MKLHTIKSSREFRRIMNTGRGWSDRNLVMKRIPSDSSNNRYGFVVSKKVGGAVIRNLVRRRLKEIFRAQILSTGYDIVLIARQAAGSATFAELEHSSRQLARRAGLA